MDQTERQIRVINEKIRRNTTTFVLANIIYAFVIIVSVIVVIVALYRTKKYVTEQGKELKHLVDGHSGGTGGGGGDGGKTEEMSKDVEEIEIVPGTNTVKPKETAKYRLPPGI